MKQRPGGLTAVCVVAIMLGSLGILAGLTGAAGMAMRSRVQAFSEKMQPDADAAQLQRRVSQRTNALWDEHPVRTWSLVAGRLLVATSLVVGGWLAFKLKRAGRKLLLATFAAGVLFELLQIIPSIQVANASYDAMQQAIEARPSENNERPPGINQTLAAFMKASAIMQIVIVLVLMAAKCSYYVIGFWYLKRGRAAVHFRPRTAGGALAVDDDL